MAVRKSSRLQWRILSFCKRVKNERWGTLFIFCDGHSQTTTTQHSRDFFTVVFGSFADNGAAFVFGGGGDFKASIKGTSRSSHDVSDYLLKRVTVAVE
jgi:hypothetical protein